uniref:Uncharacterized protein n=1 Tax=Alexandrium monilatum TaxID=311494 RepID=A0A6T1J9E9_9DINO
MAQAILAQARGLPTPVTYCLLLDFPQLETGAPSTMSAGADLSSYDRAARKSPPLGWSASKSQSYFKDGREGTQGLKNLPERAGPQGGGGSSGPALPFRIIETQLFPKGVGSRAVFTMNRARKEETVKADAVMFLA